jgi:RNA-binding protein
MCWRAYFEKMQAVMQIGKNGLTEGFFETISNSFKKHMIVKVSVLKNATRNRDEVKEIAEKIVARLGANYDYRLTGFTILVKKFKKAVR